MSEQLHKNLFNPTECLSEQTLFDYIDNKLSAEQRFAVEKHLIDCELCSDALEGLSLLKDRTIIDSIKKEVGLKFTPVQKKEPKVIGMSFRYRVLAVAASLALLIGSVFIFKNYIDKSKDVVADNSLPVKEEFKQGTPSTGEQESLQKTEDEIELKKSIENTEQKSGPATEHKPNLKEEQISPVKEPEPREKEKYKEEKNPVQRDNGSASGYYYDQQDKNADLTTKTKPDNAKSQGEDDKIVINGNLVEKQMQQPRKDEPVVNNAPAGKAVQYESPKEIIKENEAAKLKGSKKESENSLAFGSSRADEDSRKKSESSGDKKRRERETATDQTASETMSSANYNSTAAKADDPKAAEEKMAKAGKASADKSAAAPSATSTIVSDTKKFNTLSDDQKPQYPGGDYARQKFIKDNMDPTKCDACNGGTVYVAFTINEQGQVQDPKVENHVSGCDCYDTEALRIIRLMPNWTPGKTPTKTRYKMPVTFSGK